jgi:L-2,4-diaminobutyrate decarboxylase
MMEYRTNGVVELPHAGTGTSKHQLALKVLEQCLTSRATTSSQPIVSISSPETTRHIRDELSIPSRTPTSITSLLAAADLIYNDRVRMDHPRFFGFIPSPASDASWLGSMLNDAYNTHAGSWMQSSGPSAVEMRLLEWMACEVVGFPEGAGGCFVSGGSMANLTALTVARDRKLEWEEQGKAVVYMSEQTHSSVAKALRVLGFHERQMRRIACDEAFRMRVSDLRGAIGADRVDGKVPFLVVGSAGTTNTGAIDPLDELADIAEREGLWLHVDGAYGASALLCKSQRELFRGIERCDSLSWDAHKWLFQTYGCGMVLVRDRKVLTSSFGVSAEYVQDAAETEERLPNFWNYGIELTRSARAMKLWFSLQLEGLDKVERDIEHGIRLAEVAEQTLRILSDWEILSSAQLAILCLRYRPQNRPDAIDLDVVNQSISQAAIAERLAAPLTTKLNGEVVLRICCIHPDLAEQEMVEVIHGLDRIARSTTERCCALSR